MRLSEYQEQPHRSIVRMVEQQLAALDLKEDATYVDWQGDQVPRAIWVATDRGLFMILATPGEHHEYTLEGTLTVWGEVRGGKVAVSGFVRSPGPLTVSAWIASPEFQATDKLYEGRSSELLDFMKVVQRLQRSWAVEGGASA
jgi:hypothetical protein